jgi:hypothetical protein
VEPAAGEALIAGEDRLASETIKRPLGARSEPLASVSKVLQAGIHKGYTVQSRDQTLLTGLRYIDGPAIAPNNWMAEAAMNRRVGQRIATGSGLA